MTRTMLITGATGGIGAVVARAAAGRGYRVMAAGRDSDQLDRQCVEIPGSVPVLLDLRSPGGVATSLPPRWSVYAASKTALRELADSLRAEEATHGLRVTTIHPGGTATSLLAKVRAQFGHPYHAADCIQPATLAPLVLTVLDMRDDAYLSEVSVRPTPRP
jgi:NADP-dependent 3-hydroxy acid dehydrogenase YdfG